MDNSAGTGRGVRSDRVGRAAIAERHVPLSDDSKTHDVRVQLGDGEQLTHDRHSRCRRRSQSLPDKDLGLLQLSTVLYYLRETNPDNGLVRDKTDRNAPVSIAAVAWRWRRFRSSSSAASYRNSPPRSPETTALPARCPQGPEPDASGYKGFFYHFLTSKRVAAFGSASFPPSTRRFCSRAR